MKAGAQVRYLPSYEAEHHYREIGTVQSIEGDCLVVAWPRIEPACAWGCHPRRIVHDVITTTPQAWLREV